MEPNSDQFQSTTPDTSNNNAVMPSASSQKPNQTKLFIIGGIVLAVLLVAAVILAVFLINKSKTTDSSTTSTSQSNSTTNGQQTATPTASPTKTILTTAKSTDDKLEFVVYKPTQNASNTTINYAVRNTCSGCAQAIWSGNIVSNAANKVTSYLVDDAAGKKYTAITDEDGKVLATPVCGSNIKYNETTECFVSFARVPSGSTVSWTFGPTRIDGIKID